MKRANFIGDKAVLFTCILGATFLIGLEIGEAKPVPKVCPVFEGLQVTSTAATRDGEYCYYTTAKVVGYATKKVKL